MTIKSPMISSYSLIADLCLCKLDLSAAFYTTDHYILLRRLQDVIWIKGTVLGWFKTYLSDRFQFFLVNEESSSHTRVSCGVPQGSVLGPILFTLYMLPSGNFIRQHGINFHSHVDDTQLCLSMKRGETNQLVKLQAYRQRPGWLKLFCTLIQTKLKLFPLYLSASGRNETEEFCVPGVMVFVVPSFLSDPSWSRQMAALPESGSVRGFFLLKSFFSFHSRIVHA